MDRSYMINEYVNDNEISQTEMENTENYLDGLRFRINGSKSVAEVMREVSKFLDNNQDLPSELHDGILDIVNGFDENTDTYTAINRLDQYLDKNLDEKKADFTKTNDTLMDVKQELIDESKRRLDEAGIEFTGDTKTQEQVLESINTRDDIDRIINNVNRADDYVYERNKDNETNQIEQDFKSEVSMDVTEQIVDSPKDDIILNEALANQEVKGNNSLLNEKDDGSLEIKGDILLPDTVNFTNMMVAMIVASSMKLDMKFIKEKEDINNFRVLLANFPVANRPDNRLDSNTIEKINQIASGYNSYADYSDVLNTLSPELAILMKIVNENVMGQKGAFQFAVNNDGDKHNIAVAMDENYEHLRETFLDNGVTMLDSIPDSKRMIIPDTIPGDQLATLSNIDDALIEEMQKNANPQMMLKLGEMPTNNQTNSEAANANLTFLIIAAIAEVLLVGFYIFFLR